MTVDITQWVKLVRAVDVSATLKAFVAVLAPFAVLANLAEISGFIRQVAEFEFDFSGNWAIVAGFIMAALLFAFAPLAFIALDWFARREVARHVSAIAAALLGALGFALLGTLIGAIAIPLDELSEEPFGLPHLALLSIAALLLSTLGVWLTARSKAMRWVLTGLLTTNASVVLSVLTAFVMALADDMDAWTFSEFRAHVLPTLVLILGVVSFAWVLLRTVRLRLALALHRPRSLLLGDLNTDSFWVRMAFLIGLPASLWNASAFRRSAFWAFLSSRPLVYLGALALTAEVQQQLGSAVGITLAVLCIVSGHVAFFAGKRLAARYIWSPAAEQDARAPILFLRSFEDDQLQFRRPWWNLVARWFDLWSFRRNADEAMIDEVAQYGPVVALGQPGQTRLPFGAKRYYASHDDWQRIIVETARKAQAIVIAAGVSPGVLWEYELLERENLLGKTLLLFRPSAANDDINQRALEAFPGAGVASALELAPDQQLIAWVQSASGPLLLSATQPTAAAYIVALRVHFQNPRGQKDLPSASQAGVGGSAAAR